MAKYKIDKKALLEHLLKESDPVERPKSIADFTPQEKKDSSLDQALDKYLVQYEREAIPTSEMYESADLNKLTNYLFEQDAPADDEEPPAELDLGGAEGGDGPDVGGAGLDLDLGGAAAEDNASAGGEETSAAPVVNTPKINIQDFARSVARLTNNFQSLIDFKSIILNRAEKYVKSNYSDSTAKELMEILERSFDLKPADQNVSSISAEKNPQPRTGVTGPVSGG